MESSFKKEFLQGCDVTIVSPLCHMSHPDLAQICHVQNMSFLHGQGGSEKGLSFEVTLTI